MKLKAIVAAASLSLACASCGPAGDAPLKLEVYRANEKSFFVGSTLVTGKTEAVLIDAQFTLADAKQVVAKIRNSGKRLKAIYISHGDPDYYFGLQEITGAFPEARVYSSAPTLEHIKQTYEKKLAFWGPKLGANGPDRVILPEVLPGDELSVDGHVLKIAGLDSPGPERTYVYIPSLKAVIGGVGVYGDLHLWMADAATAAERAAWLKILDGVLALEPKIVIPGHARPEAPETVEAVHFSREYLQTYEQKLDQAQNSEELIRGMQAAYPNAKLNIALEIGAKVSMGEMQW